MPNREKILSVVRGGSVLSPQSAKRMACGLDLLIRFALCAMRFALFRGEIG